MKTKNKIWIKLNTNKENKNSISWLVAGLGWKFQHQYLSFDVNKRIKSFIDPVMKEIGRQPYPINKKIMMVTLEVIWIWRSITWSVFKYGNKCK